MTRARFVPNPAFEAELLGSSELVAGLTALTNEAAEAAKLFVPRRLGFLSDSIEVVVGFSEGRIVGRVVAKDFKAGFYEFGTRTMPAGVPFLRPGLAAALPGAPIVGGGRT